MFLGRLDPIKRVGLLIDAFDRITEEPGLAHWRLVIAGDGLAAHVSQLREHAKKSSARERIEFVGWLSDETKTEALCGAALVVLLSRHENFGRAAAEAMSLGVPVCITDDVFLAEKVRRCQAGWVVQGLLEEVSRALREAMVNPQMRKRLGVSAKRLASEHFSVKNSTEILMARYRGIVGS